MPNPTRAPTAEIPEVVFVDTSALYALLDRDDAHHSQAKDIWAQLLAAEVPLLTHSYVLVESFALVQRRLGLEATRALHDDLIPVLEIVWVEEDLHPYNL